MNNQTPANGPTPGPWFIDGAYVSASFNSGQPFVCRVLSDAYRTAAETEANLRLLAGSVLMYATLKETAERLRIAASGDKEQRTRALRSSQGAIARVLEIIEHDKHNELKWKKQ